MSETAEAVQQTTEFKGAVKMGKPEPFDARPPQQDTQAASSETTNSQQSNNNADAGSGASDNNTQQQQQQPPADQPELTDEQILALLDKRGIKAASLKDLAPKPAAAPEPTEEEKLEQEKLLDKRAMDLFIENGGTAESYVGLKQIASMDLKELSEKQIRAEMKEAGFDETEISDILKERYYQIKLDELEQNPTESDDEFEARKSALEKKMKFGTAQLEKRGTEAKTKAQAALDQLRNAISQTDLLKREEEAEEKTTFI